MIIDLILDRKDIEASSSVSVSPVKLDDFYVPVTELYPADEVPEELRGGYCYHYSAAAFYRRVWEYGSVGEDIRQALDYGTEEDVKRALCGYIDGNEYNPEIKDYINSVDWLDGAA